MCYSGRDADEVVQRHIKLLHTYNEIKDGAQRLIGAVRGFSLDDAIQSIPPRLVLGSLEFDYPAIMCGRRAGNPHDVEESTSRAFAESLTR